MLRILHDTKIDFIRLRRIAATVSLAFIVPALLWIAIGGFRYSVEFTGGTLVELRFAQAPKIGDVRDALGAAGLRDAEVQTLGSARDDTAGCAGAGSRAARRGRDVGRCHHHPRVDR